MMIGVNRQQQLNRALWPKTLLLLLAFSLDCAAAEPEKPSVTATNAPVQEISPGIFTIGSVRLDKRLRTVTFPAAVKLEAGLIEYLIVTTYGKTHESLLQTEVEPFHLQVAMLLLGAKGAQLKPLTNAPAGGPIKGDELVGGTTPPIRGEPVNLEVRWKLDGAEKVFRIEELVLDLRNKSPMSKSVFTFNGSRVWEGRFIAQRDGSIVSLITDEDALFNNPRPGRENDSNWEIISNILPPRGTPVQVTIRLETKPAKK